MINSTTNPGYPPPQHAPEPGGEPAWGPPPPQLAQTGTNTMAVLAIVFAFLIAPLGIVFGAIGRSQISRTGQQGKGLATAGLVLGTVFTLAGVGVIALGSVVAKTVTPSVSQASVESQISDQLQMSGATRPQSVSCTKDLPAKVGASIVCTVNNPGKSVPVTATVTSVDGDTAHFDISSGPSAAAPTAANAAPANAAPANAAPDNSLVRQHLQPVTAAMEKQETTW